MATADASETGNSVLPQRLQSLDAYRGMIMVALAFVGFGLAGTAREHLKQTPDDSFWQAVEYQFSHAEWVGCSFWDMIQPSFMFMVGVSMAYSYARREERGHSYRRMLRHALWRSLILVLLSIFLISQWHDRTQWSFVNVLAQIGLGYPFLFLLWNRSARVKIGTGIAILLITWAAYELYPHAGLDVKQGDPEVGVPADWAAEHLSDVRAPWHKNANLGHAFDVWFLNLFPREEPFRFNAGGYHTINFIPSIVTMLIGLMCGQLLRSDRTSGQKMAILIASGILGLAIGQLLHTTGVCPLVKRIWTPSWALFSGGWCCLILAALYLVIDVWSLRRWSWPFVVVGMNSIAMYCMSMSLKPWTARQWKIHFGKDIFQLKIGWIDASASFGSLWQPTIQATLVGLVFWLVCWYLYRHRMFVRI